MMRDWAGTAAAYDVSFARLCAGAAPFVLERIRAADVTGRALDAGSGTGALAATLVEAGFEVDGVDADAGMVAFAALRHPDASFRTEALPRLSSPDGAYDAVVAAFVVNHVAQPRAVMAELVRVTRPGGVVVATIWPSQPVSAMNRMWNGVIDSCGTTPVPGGGLPAEDDFERSPDGLRGLLEGAGLVSVDAALIAWDFVIGAEDLWAAVEAGIATIGRTYLAQDAERRRAMRREYERMTDLAELTLPSVAVIASGRVADCAADWAV